MPRRRPACCSPAGRSSSRRAATPASGWRSWRSSAATTASSSAPTRSAATRSTLCAPTVPRSPSARPRSPRRSALLLLGLGPARPRDAGWLETRPVREPGEPPLALRDDRARALGADRGAHHPLRRRHRNRRHHQRHRPVPQGEVGRRRPRRRRRPRGLGLLRRHRAALPRRGRRRGLLAGHLRPVRSATRSSRSRTRTPST